MVHATDYVLIVIGTTLDRIFEVSFDLRPYTLSIVWHPRGDGDAGHRFLRDVFVRASREVAGERHEEPRTRLDATDPTSGQARKRLRRAE